MILFIVGYHATGKTFSAKMLESFGFVLIDTGPIIRNIHKKSNFGVSLEQWIKEGEIKQGKDYTNYIITEEIKNIISNVSTCKGIVIIGNRSIEGIKYIQKHLNLCDKENYIIYIDALFEKMQERYNEREKKQLTNDEFLALIKKEDKQGMIELKKHADFILLNNGSPEELKEKLVKIVFKELKNTL